MMKFLPNLLRRSRGVSAVAVEQRDAAPVRISDTNSLMQMFGFDAMTTAGEVVTTQTALTVPAFWAAVKFISSTMASLPIAVYEKTEDGNVKVEDHPITALLARAPNAETSSYSFFFDRQSKILTEGRQVSFIERNQAGEVINLWPLSLSCLRLERRNGRTLYHYRDGARTFVYQSDEVIDLGFMPGEDRLQNLSPVTTHRETIALAIAIARYGAKIFGNGGIPPFVVTGPMKTAGGMARAADDMTQALQQAHDEGKNSVAMPDGHEIKSVGVDPEKMQMIDAQRFIVEQFARIFSLPPTFLQDLTNGTFSNTEQQDGYVAKHTISHWANAWEQELNLKLFGRVPDKYFVKMNMNALLRGDFKGRMDALARAIQTGQLTPNEARALEDRGNLAGGDVLYMQGATVPIETQTEGETQNE